MHKTTSMSEPEGFRWAKQRNSSPKPSFQVCICLLEYQSLTEPWVNKLYTHTKERLTAPFVVPQLGCRENMIDWLIDWLLEPYVQIFFLSPQNLALVTHLMLVEIMNAIDLLFLNIYIFSPLENLFFFLGGGGGGGGGGLLMISFLYCSLPNNICIINRNQISIMQTSVYSNTRCLCVYCFPKVTLMLRWPVQRDKPG